MARPELGIKRQCMNCGAKFYDLARDPATCPKCGAVYQMAATRGAAPALSRKNEDEDEDEDENRPDVVSLDEAEQSDDTASDDESGDDDDSSGGGTDDDTFLEEEDGDDDVSDLIDNDGDNDEES